MINAQGRLLVIEDFQVDRNLPKYQKRYNPNATSKGEQYQSVEENESEKYADEDFAPNITFSTFNVSGGGVTRLTVQGPTPPVPWYVRWFGWLSPKPKEPAPTMTIEDFFKSVKHSAQELTIVEARAKGYEAALTNAKKAGQQALFEKLAAGLNAFKMETQLLALGLTKFVNEEDIVRFYKQSKKGLRLDWIRNFTRPIPEPITARKAHADELGIFDNYVVLHYDPQAKSFAETEAEKAARKDPILFGLMKDRTQLYVVGDWVDEHCDLTLDQFAEIMGAQAIKTVEDNPPS